MDLIVTARMGEARGVARLGGPQQVIGVVEEPAESVRHEGGADKGQYCLLTN